MSLAKHGIGILMYGTPQKLESVQSFRGLIKLDSTENAKCLREALLEFGYNISFTKKEEFIKPPTIGIARKDNALFFSVYNANITTDTHLKFPLGAPILCGTDTEITDEKSSYRFSRSEHRECRVFAKQKDGVISCREAPPVNARYRRAIKIKGLNDATVFLFPEKGCESVVSTSEYTDYTPESDPRFKVVNDETYGNYFKGEHISGNIYFLIGHKR